MPTQQTVRLCDIVFDPTIYPRKKHDPARVQQYAADLEVIEACGKYISLSTDKRLIDGRHRHLAYLTRYAGEPEREIPVLVYDMTDDRDLRGPAGSLNSEAGWQMPTDEKSAWAIRRHADGKTQDEIAKELHVSKDRVAKWLAATLETERKEREAKMWSLYLSCHTHGTIAEEVGITRTAGTEFLQKMSESFQGADSDIFRNFEPKIYRQWYFPTATNAVKVFGSIPPEIIDNLLWGYTKPLDVVFDPFGGGGCTIDKCIERIRRYYVSDLSPIPARQDIRQWDISDGLPPDLPVPDLVFLDPPYWKQGSGKYSEKPSDLGNVGLEAFVAGIGKIARDVKRKWGSSRPNGKLALIIGPYQEGGREIDLAFLCKAAIEKYLPSLCRISVPYSTEIHGGAYVEAAKQKRETLYITRDLMVFGGA